MASMYVCMYNVYEIATSPKVLGIYESSADTLEQTNHGNGEGDTSTKEGITVKYHPPFSFINIGQRGRILYIRLSVERGGIKVTSSRTQQLLNNCG